MTGHLKSLQSLPFYNLTNIELYNVLDTIDHVIKQRLQDRNFSQHISATIPNSNVLDKPCKYYSTDELASIIKNQPASTLKILHQNIVSLDKHFGELIALLTTLHDNFDFIALSEIGKKNIQNYEGILKNLGYNFKYQMPTLQKGGVALIYKDIFKLKERSDLKVNSRSINGKKLVVENIWYETDFVNKNDNFIIGVIYKHPKGSVECMDSFTQQLANTMIKINNEKKKCIMTGDINIDGLKLASNNHVKFFFNTVLEQNFIPTITLPTRIVDHSISLLDHIFINQEIIKSAKSVLSGNLYSGISDHLPNFIMLNFDKKAKQARPVIRIFGDNNSAKFKQYLENSSWDDFFASQDVNKALDIFYLNYNTAFNKAFPLKIQSKRRSKDKKWITSSLKKCVSKKDSLYKKQLHKPTNQNKSNYTKYKNILISCLRTAEEIYYRDILTSEKNNLTKMWNLFGSVINPQKIRKDNNIKELIMNNIKVNGDQEIADTFNEFFSTVGSKLANKFQNKNSHTYQNFLKHPIQQSFFLSPTDTDETLKEINKLNHKKSVGHDNISAKLLKLNAENLADKIVHIINLSFSYSTVPDQFKIAKVIPIHKKNETNLPGNYRPISLLSTLNKIMERLMFKRLMKFCDLHNILYNYQFGFREGYSTSLALIEIVDNIYSDLADNKYVAGIFLDLSKAFDTVDHGILLQKLKFYGVRGVANDWFRSYVTNRKQFTVVNNKKSKLQPIEFGVPQGSVLGPLLFLIYINDISNAIDPENKVRLFADDNNIFISKESPNQLKEAMINAFKNIFAWFNANKLTVNLDKTCYTIFKRKRQKIPEILNNISIDNITIKRVRSTKYLGVTLDENLSWNEHTEILSKTLMKIANSFKLIKNHVPTKNKMPLYFAYIFSRIQYGIEVFGNTTQKNLKKIQKQQNRAVKILFNKDYFTPTKKLHHDLNMLQIRDIYKLYLLKFTYKHQNDALPKIFDNFFTLSTDTHPYKTRQERNLRIVHDKNSYHGKTIKQKANKLWNSLDHNTKSSLTLKNFTKKVKTQFIDLYD